MGRSQKTGRFRLFHPCKHPILSEVPKKQYLAVARFHQLFAPTPYLNDGFSFAGRRNFCSIFRFPVDLYIPVGPPVGILVVPFPLRERIFEPPTLPIPFPAFSGLFVDLRNLPWPVSLVWAWVFHFSGLFRLKEVSPVATSKIQIRNRSPDTP